MSFVPEMLTAYKPPAVGGEIVRPLTVVYWPVMNRLPSSVAPGPENTIGAALVPAFESVTTSENEPGWMLTLSPATALLADFVIVLNEQLGALVAAAFAEPLQAVSLPSTRT